MQAVMNEVRRLEGELRVPGDKSVAHRALILGALARGRQEVAGLPDSQDVASTAACLAALGYSVERRDGGGVTVSGSPRGGEFRLDAGNSGTTARLLAGMMAGLRLKGVIDGDASLRRRPMSRIADPLTLMGADVATSPDGRLPLRLGGGKPSGITYAPPQASAQVKSAVLLAGLGAEGATTVLEPVPTRDHTEIMLAVMGVPVARAEGSVTVPGGARPEGVRIEVPGDVSSAAFFAAAASVHPDADLRLQGVGVNPTRTGFLEVLERMGARIERENERIRQGEAVADLRVRTGRLQGVEIAGALVPKLIDELPVLAVAASQAEGATVVRDAAELRHKESDRIAATVANLRRMGADIEERDDGFVVRGPCRLRGAAVEARGDHRIVMAMAVAGLVARGTTRIDDCDVAAVSYPAFFEDLRRLCR